MVSAAADDIPLEDPRPGARSVVVGATRPDEARRLLALAAPVARAREAKLLLVYVAEAVPGEEPTAEVDASDLVPLGMSSLVTVLRHRSDPELSIRSVIRQHHGELVVLEWRRPAEDTGGTAEERATRRRSADRTRRLFLDPPCEAWLVDGSLGGRPIRSILLLPANGLPAAETLQAARTLRESGGRVTYLDVSSKDGKPPAEALTARLNEGLDHDRHTVRSVRATSRERAAVDEIGRQTYDLLIAEAPDAGVLPMLAAPEVPVDLIQRAGIPTVIVNRPQSRIAVRIRGWWGRVYRWTATLDEEERVVVYSDLRRGARADRDFLTLTALSTAIAALGLLLNSAAVIIGAMLVAPFMAPLIALGLAVVHGDARFMRVAATAVVRGTLVAYPIGILLGVLVPQVNLGDEVLARTEPSGLDLLVALLSGAAGAYAYARRDLSAALPGVAIAAALVPPLAASAIALGSGEMEEAAGAALLYALNVTAISAAAAVVFMWFGFRPESQRLGRMRAFFGGFAMIVVLVVAMLAAVIFLGNRDRVSAQLERAVTTTVEDWLPEGDELDQIDVDEAGAQVHIRIRVESATLRTAEDVGELAVLLAERVDRPVDVDLVVIPVARGAAVPPEEPEQ